MTLYANGAEVYGLFQSMSDSQAGSSQSNGSGLCLFCSCPLSLGMKLDCSPIVYPAVAGGPQPIPGQEAVLVRGHLFFSHRGLETEPCPMLLEEDTLLPDLPSEA